MLRERANSTAFFLLGTGDLRLLVGLLHFL
jgi:hypothetical protein